MKDMARNSLWMVMVKKEPYDAHVSRGDASKWASIVDRLPART